MSAIHYDQTKGRYVVRKYFKHRYNYIGEFDTEIEAQAALRNYLHKLSIKSTDFNTLARNPQAWERKAKASVKELTEKYGAK